MENESKVEEPKPEPPLVEALRKQLQSILEKPLTPGALLELEQTARLSRELLVIGKMPDARRHGYPGMMMSGLGGLTPIYDGATVSSAYAPSPQSETFGTSMIRELVSKLPDLMKPKEIVHRESASSLIDAIAAARENKMDDVVEKLKAKLDALLAEPEPAELVMATPPRVVNTDLGGATAFAGPPGFEPAPLDLVVSNVLASGNEKLGEAPTPVPQALNGATS